MAAFLVGLFVLIAYPTLKSVWFRKRKLGVRVIGMVCVALAVVIFGLYVWPPTLAVAPEHVVFGANPNDLNPSYTFRLTNQTDEDVYLAELDLIVDDPTRSGTEFLVNIPKASQVPLGEAGIGAQATADIMGTLCRTKDRRSFFALSVSHLRPREMREVTLTHVGYGRITMSAEPGYFSEDPNSIGQSGSVVSRNFQFSRDTDGRGCPTLIFGVDETFKQYDAAHPKTQ